MRFLRTNTAIRVTVGPFLDKTDGVTPEVALTVTNCHLTLMVDTADVPTLVLDANATASAGNNDMVHVTNDDAGFYDLELTAAQLNYLGRAMLAITDAANHCPVFHELMILPAMIYDAMVLGTDVLDVSVTQLLGTAWLTPAVAGTPDVNAKLHGGTAQTGRDIGASVLLSPGTGTGQLDFTSGVVKANLVQIIATAITETVGGYLAAGFKKLLDIAAPVFTLASLNQTGDAYARLGAPAGASVSADVAAVKADTAAILVDTGTTLDARIPAALVGGKMDAHVNDIAASAITAAAIAPDAIGASELAADAVAEIADQVWDEAIAGHVGAGSTGEKLNNASAPTAATVADAVWDEILSGHLGAGSTGNALNAAGSAGDPWATAIPGAYGAGTAGKILGDNINAPIATVDTVVDAIKAKTDNLPTDPADESLLEAAITAATSPLATAANLATVDTVADAIKAKTDNLPAAPADDTSIDSQLAIIAAYIDTEVAAILAAVDTEVAAIKAKTDLLPAAPAATGDAMTLTAGERDSVATALLDLANAIETGLTFRNAMRLALSSLAGKISGAATATVTARNAIADTKNRIVATVDADGNRSAVTVDLT